MVAVKKKVTKKKAVSKTAVKKKVTSKKVARKKSLVNLPLEPKLGHDPLAWITGNEDNVVSRTNIVVEPEVDVQPVEDETIVDEVISHLANDDAMVEEDVECGTSEQPVAHFEEDAVIVEEVPVNKITESNDDKDKTMLILPDIFGIAQADVTYQAIKELLSTSDEIKIDASVVETVDASALQLLIALVNECKSQGKKISWHAQSDKINDSAKLLNLTELLDL
ncbi:MAG: STAS domain-containing protein [Gammaproteobacteria bacterium]|nr:STAS domain-containing protein [Gammaproteobacteria bacterium]